MKISSIILGSLFFFYGGIQAQVKKTASSGLHFQSINTVGLIDGQSGGALQLLTINGVQYRGWFLGIGAGIDEYRLKSVPVFADLRRTITHNFFLYADGGLNWHREKANDVKQFYINDKFNGGFYGEAGLGYNIKLYRSLRLLFEAGYNMKRLAETGSNYWEGTTYYVIPPPMSSSGGTINYHLNSIVIKAGIAF